MRNTTPTPSTTPPGTATPGTATPGSRTRRGATAGAVALSLCIATLLAGCGDDGEAVSGVVVDGRVEVEMVDFDYVGLPTEVPAGTDIVVTNSSPGEIHEFVAFRLPDDDERPVEQIVSDDLGGLLGGSLPSTVLLAAPGGPEIAVVGDGTLDEPGRYAIVCVIPTGADPQEYLDAAATSDGPPQVDGGPPHVVNGMFAELTVTR